MHMMCLLQAVLSNGTYGRCKQTLDNLIDLFTQHTRITLLLSVSAGMRTCPVHVPRKRGPEAARNRWASLAMIPPETTQPAHAEINANATDARSAKAVAGFLGMIAEDEVELKLRTRFLKGCPVWIVRSALLLLLCRASSGADDTCVLESPC